MKLNLFPLTLRALVLVVLSAVTGLRLTAQPVADNATNLLVTAAQIRQLTPEQAAQHRPVSVRGVVTFFDPGQFFRFIQDDSAGIYFYLDNSVNNPGLMAGKLIEINGETSPGEYAPIILPHQIKIVGDGKFPAAKPATLEQVASGEDDSQFVEVHGIVRSAQWNKDIKYFMIEITTGGGRLTALAAKLPVNVSDDLVDSTVRIRGVCVTRFNLQRQLFDARILVPRPEDLVVESPAPKDPFAIPARQIEQLLQFAPQGSYGHRVKVAGTVIYRESDDVLYIQDATEGLSVETTQAGSLSVGDHVEVLGFPSKGEYTPMLRDAVFRKTGTSSPPPADLVTADEALSGKHDCRLIRIEATLLDRARHSLEQFVVLQSGGFIFHAYLPYKGPGTDFADLQNGSKVTITGVCLIEMGNDWHYGTDWRAKSFRVLMRSPGDIFVRQQPPWWNLEKMLWATGVLALLVFTALSWVGILRRRVQKQTAIILHQLQTEAALKERYENLFENANDMVFTHDPDGRITSINKTGEQLLRRDRKEILGHNLAGFVAEDQREGAQHWLEQVSKGAQLAPAEWDFINADGQRFRLEISALLVEQAGSAHEIESVARDVTERKRLEREILEISNREQRRIGHDLHDGVCQQLAAIAYRVDILADQLDEKKFPESSEATRIGSLLNEAMSQTRGVARGLFPVRLEEEGLISALEEVALNATRLFRLRCEFACVTPHPKPETTAALHLYYITQEAVLNAAKHGNATEISVTITRQQERFVLTVRDNGKGFAIAERASGGMGIRIMRYRAQVIGATLDLKSQPGQGTQVTCTFHGAT
ncbi:MAG TPA: PAS domain-containing sensor histidine kinase [Verrucomicrobiae bacterium]|jgi:PAS domain S-box-containing protein